MKRKIESPKSAMQFDASQGTFTSPYVSMWMRGSFALHSARSASSLARSLRHISGIRSVLNSTDMQATLNIISNPFHPCRRIVFKRRSPKPSVVNPALSQQDRPDETHSLLFNGQPLRDCQGKTRASDATPPVTAARKDRTRFTHHSALALVIAAPYIAWRNAPGPCAFAATAMAER